MALNSKILAADMLSSLRSAQVGYWPLGRDGALTLNDDGPNAFVLTNNAAAAFATGPSKQVDGSQLVAASLKYFSRADSVPLRSQGQLYVSAWLFLDSKPAAAMYPASKTGNAGGNFGWGMQWTGSAGDRFAFFVSTDGTALPTAVANVFGAPALSTWYFVEGWWDGSTVNVSVNLSNEAPVAAATLFSSTGALNIGNFALIAGSYWDGRIADVLYLNRVPSRAERVWLYNAGQGRDLRRAA